MAMKTNKTENLRATLDRRGIVHKDYDATNIRETKWRYDGTRVAVFQEWSNGNSHFYFDYWSLNPEQIVEVTLGREVCEDVGDLTVFKCCPALSDLRKSMQTIDCS